MVPCYCTPLGIIFFILRRNMEEELDIEQQKIKLKEQIETLKLQLELIARRSGKKENDIKIGIIKRDLAKLNSEYIHLISQKYIKGEDEL